VEKRSLCAASWLPCTVKKQQQQQQQHQQMNVNNTQREGIGHGRQPAEDVKEKLERLIDIFLSGVLLSHALGIFFQWFQVVRVWQTMMVVCLQLVWEPKVV
jgi:hypothetical protein